MDPAKAAKANAQLPTLIRQQHTVSLQLQRLLEQEREAVQKREQQQLLAAVERKQALVAELETLESRRKELAREAGYPDAELSQHPDLPLRTLWRELMESIEQCRQANLANHALIEASRQFTAQVLSILTGSAGEIAGPSVYNPGGDAVLGSSNRSFGEA